MNARRWSSIHCTTWRCLNRGPGHWIKPLRERRANERCIRQAKFPVVKSIDSFDFLAIPSLKKTLELARCEFLVRRENVLLPGNSGTGKTHIAPSLGLAACQRGHRVRFTTTAALVSQLIEARDERKPLRYRPERLRQAVAVHLITSQSQPPAHSAPSSAGPRRGSHQTDPAKSNRIGSSRWCRCSRCCRRWR